jgi:hypothetical protein
MLRPIPFALGALLLVGVSYAAAMDASAPDDRLTPGALATTNTNEVCGGGPGDYSRRHRVWNDKPSTLAKYGIPPPAARLYEDDDRVPVCLGGNNADPRNHWPQPWHDAREKDQLEAWACRAVCDSHSMPLAKAQALFLADWRTAVMCVKFSKMGMVRGAVFLKSRTTFLCSIGRTIPSPRPAHWRSAGRSCGQDWP